MTFMIRGHIHIEMITCAFGLISSNRKSDTLNMKGKIANEATTRSFISVRMST